MSMIVHDTFLDRTIFLIIGMIFGLLLSWVRDAVLEARSARIVAERLEKTMTRHRNERGLTLLHRKSLVVVLILTAAAAIMGGFATVKQVDVANEIRKTQDCYGDSLGAVIEALNERTSLSSDLNVANKEAVQADQVQTRAFVTLIATVLKVPPVPEKKARDVFEAYQVALVDKERKQDAYLTLLNKSQEAQKSNPFPSVKKYNACLHNAGTDKDK